MKAMVDLASGRMGESLSVILGRRVGRPVNAVFANDYESLADLPGADGVAGVAVSHSASACSAWA